jgi:hypothetical protein
MRRTFISIALTSTVLMPAWADKEQTQQAPELKPFDSVITKEAKSQPGVFNVHRVKEKLYYEIPKKSLNKDFLWVTQVAKTTLGSGYGGEPVDQRVVRWVRRNDQIQLLDIQFDIYADPSKPIAKAVEAANRPTILAAFPIEAHGKDDSCVVEVSKLFVSPPIELTPKYFLGASALEASRSYLEASHSFPENIEVEATLTLTRPPDSGTPRPIPGINSAPMSPGSATIVVHSSMVKLPEKPMMPRLRDSRVGYFSHRQIDFGAPHDRIEPKEFIARWRLEKKDPAAELSEPIKPIVFYIDPATPTEWVPYVKKGVEAWQSAFEEAGFKNAIQAWDAPQNPDWSPEDARYSVIRWLPSNIRNAYGPHISDPRSGEILEADIHMFDNIIDLQRTWYLTQVGHLDARAKSLPLPNDLMGELIQFVVTHEVGHSLGLPHNMKASSTYPAAKVRDKNWVKTMGHCPSIMDYSRFNYVAQPEDGIDIKDLIPRVGPYDKFSIRWGYKPISANGPEAEKSTLDSWAREQDKTPWLRFDTPGISVDPGSLTEAVGDQDAVSSTHLGFKNIQRIMSILVNATSQYGESYQDLKTMYSRLIGQWATEANHVVAIVGGINSHNKHAGQSGGIYEVVARERQQAAVQFLLREVFLTQDWLYPEAIFSRIGGSRTQFVSDRQRSILLGLLSPRRLARMAEQDSQKQSYSPALLFKDLRTGLFQELTSSSSIIDLQRMKLQSDFVQAMLLLNLRGEPEIKAASRSELEALRHLLQVGLKHSHEKNLGHLKQLSADITDHLNPNGSRSSKAPVGHAISEAEPMNGNFMWQTCWPDYQRQSK